MKYFLCLAAFILLSCSHTGVGQDGAGESFSPFSAVVRFYRGPLNHLEAVRHGECPMHPSCSEYARQAIAKHGELMGWMMACDRLARCGRDEIRLAPRIRVNGKWKFYDPVERNDFWHEEKARLPLVGQGENIGH
ncbi:membrane protein insertion efficiency factor Yid D [Desulfonema ishimotonii]|uniref:Membrane protein insertion efficiency factor Yid D n=1 Tax=Desulfonema ishimotonii TaxID=45657 RepID=A0A401FUV0_9BACT|nr:membrane protein insertion efficiency factor YidD [Desulfonema ishimotonii]GBC60751.1 membrane protein insertion efficiency factor Yid D [Desulfonema ishimotonii]